MKLRNLELKNFGKFHDKNLEFGDGIQLVYGENEAGKSTIHSFIRAMLFGMERGRGRAALHDMFSRYEPWENENYYAGALKFECNKKLFNLQRNFDKYSKSVKLICETDGEELSVEDGDLEMLLDGLTENSYENTLYIGQLRAATGQTLAAELKNYATNYYVTGDSDIDFTAARQRLLQGKKEAEREAKQELFEKQRKREKVEQEVSFVWREIHRLDEEMQDARDELEVRRRQEAEADAHKKSENEWGKKHVVDEIRPEKWRIHPLEIIVIIFASILAFWFVPQPWNAALTAVMIILGIIYIWNRMKVGKGGKTEAEQILEEIVPEEELISTEKLTWRLQYLEGERTEKQVEYENLQEQLQEMDEFDESYLAVSRKKDALNLAIQRIDQVSEQMQRQLTLLLNQKASDIIRSLTEGRYDRLLLDEEFRISVLRDGRRIELEQLSQGTLEQIYFAFRMAAADLLYDEEYPILLDDTFAYYDDIRLLRVLRWLEKSGKQVIIFTCQQREESVMKSAGIGYTKIIL